MQKNFIQNKIISSKTSNSKKYQYKFQDQYQPIPILCEKLLIWLIPIHRCNTNIYIYLYIFADLDI